MSAEARHQASIGCMRPGFSSPLSGLVRRTEVMPAKRIRPPEGKLAVLMPGMGAVATTTMAGIILARQGMAPAVGSLTQMGRIRLGKRTNGRSPLIREFVPLADMDDLEFGGWDVFPDDAYEAAVHAEVLDKRHLDAVKTELSAIRPMKAVFYPEFVKRLHGPHVKSAPTKADMVEELRADIREFMVEK